MIDLEEYYTLSPSNYYKRKAGVCWAWIGQQSPRNVHLELLATNSVTRPDDEPPTRPQALLLQV